MKSKIRILIILVASLTFFLLFNNQAGAQANVSLQVFYDQLSPYGQWVDYGNYGYVWIPDAGPDFAPYSSNGHWVFTDYGWTWASYYEWGWAPFHYGRWNFDNYYGWFWIPDTEWAPAWVSWRMADGYYGWEPLGAGVSINISFGMQYNDQNDHWLFVRDRDFDRTDISHYYINRSENDRIGRNSRIINNTYFDNRRNTTYITGPNREDLQRATGRRVNSFTVEENSKPGQDLSNGQLHIYRPVVTINNDQGHKPVPTRVVNVKDVKRPADRRDVNQSGNINKLSTPAQQSNTNPARNNTKVQQQNTITEPARKVSTSTPVKNKNLQQQNTTTEPARKVNTSAPVKNKNVQQQNTTTEPVRRVNTSPPVKNVNVQQQNNSTKQSNEAAPTKQKNKNSTVKSTKAGKIKTERPAKIKKAVEPKRKESVQDTKKID